MKNPFSFRRPGWSFRILFSSLVVGAALTARGADFGIADYGAKTDAKPSENARAIQAAIDAAAKAGGGRVVVPAGEWTSGTVWLKSRVELHLADGAVLKASADLADYNALDAYPQNFSCRETEKWCGWHLIIAHEVEDVALTGRGTIDGNSEVFYVKKPSPVRRTAQFEWSLHGMRSAPDRDHPRPGQLVVFIESKRLRVEGVTIRHAPCWNLFFHGCEDVTVRDYTVRNGPSDANTDGVDVDSCRNVLLERMDIDTGDDAIAIRGAPARLSSRRPCENVRVRDCRLAACAEGIRIGVGDGLIRDVTIENVQIVRAGWGVLFQTAYGKGAGNGVDIENVTLRNVTMDRGCLGDHRFEIGGDRLEFGVRNILFDRCVFRGTTGGYTLSPEGHEPKNLRYENCVFERPEMRIGIIGCDTSHAVAFTKLINVEKPDFCKGFRVAAAYKWGSRDIVSATNRYPKYVAELKSMGVEMTDSIAELLRKVDAVCLETNDGREHLAQALEVFKADKLVFIDKPIAHDYADALKIYEAGRKCHAKYFSSSALRYSKSTRAVAEGASGRIAGCLFFAPSPLEKQGTHARYTWYGIHGFEPMVAVMGRGAESVRTVSSGDVDVVTVRWKDGRLATLRLDQGRWDYGGYAFPEKGSPVALGGYEGYADLLAQILRFFRTAQPPVPAEETLEIFAIMDAAERSLKAGGSEVKVPTR